MEKTHASIRVVIPVHNGEEHLASMLEPVMAELAPHDRLVVVDDRSHDGSGRVASSMGAEVIPSTGRPGAAGARNTGAEGAEEDWILFLDSDIIVPPGWRERLDSHLHGECDAVQAIYGPDTAGGGPATFYKNYYYHYTFTVRIKSRYITGCGTFFFAVRSRVFSELEGFDDMISGASIEDADFAARMIAAEYRILLARDISVLHLRDYTLSDLLTYDWKMMRAKALYLLRRDSSHGEPSISMASPGEMMPTLSGAFGVWMSASGLAALAFGWFWGVYAAAAGLSVLFAGHMRFWIASIRHGGIRGFLACFITVPDLMLILPAAAAAILMNLSGRKY